MRWRCESTSKIKINTWRCKQSAKPKNSIHFSAISLVRCINSFDHSVLAEKCESTFNFFINYHTNSASKALKMEEKESNSTPVQEDAAVSAPSEGDSKSETDFKMPSMTLTTKKKLGPSPLEVPEAPKAPPPAPVPKESSSAPKEKHPPLPYTEPPWGGKVAPENYSFEV
jgi:hypothetical protein